MDSGVVARVVPLARDVASVKPIHIYRYRYAKERESGRERERDRDMDISIYHQQVYLYTMNNKYVYIPQ